LADNYTVRDGTGASLVIKSKDVGSGVQLPQSIPSDPTGAPYSSANELPVIDADLIALLGTGADSLASNNGTVTAHLRKVWTELVNSPFNTGNVAFKGRIATYTDRSGICTPSTNMTVAAANANRAGFFIQNLSLSSYLYLNLGSTILSITTGGNIIIPPLSMWEMAAHTVYSGVINAYSLGSPVYTAKEMT